MNAEEILKEFEGTLITEVISIMQSGNFFEITGEEPEWGFDIVGTATDFEKACATLHRRITSEGKKKYYAVSSGEEGDLAKEMKAMNRRANILLNFLWDSIRRRYDPNNSDRPMSIFSGYKIGRSNLIL